MLNVFYINPATGPQQSHRTHKPIPYVYVSRWLMSLSQKRWLMSRIASFLIWLYQRDSRLKWPRTLVAASAQQNRSISSSWALGSRCRPPTPATPAACCLAPPPWTQRTMMIAHAWTGTARSCSSVTTTARSTTRHPEPKPYPIIVWCLLPPRARKEPTPRPTSRSSTSCSGVQGATPSQHCVQDVREAGTP